MAHFHPQFLILEGFVTWIRFYELNICVVERVFLHVGPDLNLTELEDFTCVGRKIYFRQIPKPDTC